MPHSSNKRKEPVIYYTNIIIYLNEGDAMYKYNALYQRHCVLGCTSNSPDTNEQILLNKVMIKVNRFFFLNFLIL